MSELRLQKIIADAGICSRRDAEQLIADGLVTINGKVARIGDKAIAGKDHIKVEGKLLKVDVTKIVIALFKPRGIMTSRPADAKDSQKNTVFEMVAKFKEKLIPVGRLDTDAEGILLLTNDGDLANRLNSAKFEVPKVYMVKIDGSLDDKRIKRLQFGIRVDDTKTKPMVVEPIRRLEGKEWVRITITEAQNRMIRKVFEAVGRPVDKVRRESFAGVTLKGLERGEFRTLSTDEIDKLRRFVGLK